MPADLRQIDADNSELDHWKAIAAQQTDESVRLAKCVAALEAERDAANARADGMELAGAEQARRADENAEWAKREKLRGDRLEAERDQLRLDRDTLAGENKALIAKVLSGRALGETLIDLGREVSSRCNEARMNPTVVKDTLLIGGELYEKMVVACRNSAASCVCGCHVSQTMAAATDASGAIDRMRQCGVEA